VSSDASARCPRCPHDAAEPDLRGSDVKITWRDSMMLVAFGALLFLMVVVRTA
jgi:hypothetical protein